MEKPLVSIIIPAYNRADLIGDTLNSVKVQTYEHWECIVVDDGSKDETKNVVFNYIKIDDRFLFFERPTSHLPGGNGARNYGALKCKGQLFVFLDSDDVLVPSAIEGRVACFKDQNYDMVLSLTGTFKRTLGDSQLIWNTLGQNFSFEHLIDRYVRMDMPWHTNGVTWNRAFFEKIGGWDENLIAWQDWELHCRSLFYKPYLHVMEHTVDNYFRNSKHDSIGKKVRSIEYMQSIYNACESINTFFRDNESVFQHVKLNYSKLVYRMLICFPVKKGFIFFPLNILFNYPIFKGVSRVLCFKFYSIELLSKSAFLRKSLLRKTFEKQEDFLKIESNFLKRNLSNIQKH